MVSLRYISHPLEPTEVTKTMDDTQTTLYKKPEENSGISLECSNLHANANNNSPSGGIKLESENAAAAGRVVNAVDVTNMTQLTPPQ